MKFSEKANADGTKDLGSWVDKEYPCYISLHSLLMYYMHTNLFAFKVHAYTYEMNIFHRNKVGMLYSVLDKKDLCSLFKERIFFHKRWENSFLNSKHKKILCRSGVERDFLDLLLVQSLSFILSFTHSNALISSIHMWYFKYISKYATASTTDLSNLICIVSVLNEQRFVLNIKYHLKFLQRSA